MWSASMLVEAVIMGSAIAVLFLVSPVYVQLGLYDGLLAVIGMSVVLMQRR